jgi:metal-sulfur cluster biosynthetic enzyme
MGHRPVDPIAASAAPRGPLELISGPLRAESVVQLLHDVTDPELGVNIVDLGLVRNVEVGEDGTVAIEMTLTTPGCPLGG